MEKPRARNRRPSKRNAARQETYLAAIRAGASRQVAASAAGVGRTTAWRWAQADAEFAAAVDRADAEAEGAMMEVINRAAPRTWRAAAWWLERRRPETYGRHAGPTADFRKMVRRMAAAEGLDADELLREVERIAARYG